MTSSTSNLQSADSEASLPLVDAETSAVRLPDRISPEELRAYLRSAEAQQRIRRVVLARLDPRTPGNVADDIVQEVNLRVLTTPTRPRMMKTAPGWLATVTAREVANHFRREAGNRKWLKRDVDVDEEAAPPSSRREEKPKAWLISEWLAPLVAEDEREQETYELIVYKARSGKSYGTVAGEHGMTASALYNRIHELKTKYLPRWRKRQSELHFVLLGGVALLAVAVALVWLLWGWLHPQRIVAPLHSVPTAAPELPLPPPDDPADKRPLETAPPPR
jgi:DNA-directed RNA polymerase specialized sigma24 family protein